MDASPTKAWLIAHRHDSEWKQAYHYAFGKRPQIELYDLKRDPDQIMNVADESTYAETKRDLLAQLSGILKDAGDPRTVGDGKTFERPPFVDANGAGANKKR
jgi:N-sulfoglucosamine sulfohydrolase